MTTETNKWVPTRKGGFRRSNADSSSVERHPDLVEARKNRGTAGREVANSLEAATRAGFNSPSAYLKKNFIIKMNERLGLETCPYVIRWRFETPWGSIRLHHWLGPDDDRARHDHPWSFVTFVLKGGYTDISPAGDQHLKAPAIQYRDAEHQHTVVPDKGGAWTVIMTGPKIRKWGFWVNGKFVKMNKYFLTYGHHPCD